jgi:hypothetical protein
VLPLGQHFTSNAPSTNNIETQQNTNINTMAFTKETKPTGAPKSRKTHNLIKVAPDGCVLLTNLQILLFIHLNQLPL